MSTIVVVRKGNEACIACDTLSTTGSRKQKAHYTGAPEKIFRFADAYIGIVGYAVHSTVLQSYFSRYPDKVDLTSPSTIFETWRQMHKVLEEEYHLNPRRESDDAYQTTRMSAVIASPRGLFGVTPARDVEEFPKFWAIGSGTDFSLGAMFAVYSLIDDVEKIARIGAEAGAEFDESSDLPVISYRVEITA